MDIQMMGTVWLVAAFLLGLLNCFFGYRLFIITVALLGLALGATLGYQAGTWLGGGFFPIALAVILGLIGLWASVSAYYAFIFVAGAFAFALLAAFLAGLYEYQAHPLLLIVVGFVGGFIALWLQRVIIIGATAAQGALASVLAVFAFATGKSVGAYRSLFNRFISGELVQTRGVWFYVGLLVWFVLFTFGLVAQVTRGKEMYRRPISSKLQPKG
ncbi:MAG: DUF4203 domain-containing protein [Candidatus Abyssobacteria bacterium SURF_17]|uniref:DUF4203 domain-containing protein n=1 Tax=Candidatus Abyssobacteria bacterium SURF_17 TaxID=2093361 RepID=A0A419ETU4_9BACT|nr:MAG: DUF4203 domain-containing protein [Candidatus Abyssubacteria bacterium SURF_17]